MKQKISSQNQTYFFLCGENWTKIAAALKLKVLWSQLGLKGIKYLLEKFKKMNRTFNGFFLSSDSNIFSSTIELFNTF